MDLMTLLTQLSALDLFVVRLSVGSSVGLVDGPFDVVFNSLHCCCLFRQCRTGCIAPPPPRPNIYSVSGRVPAVGRGTQVVLVLILLYHIVTAVFLHLNVVEQTSTLWIDAAADFVLWEFPPEKQTNPPCWLI